MKYLFIGDSVTDCDRLAYPPLGTGWVNEIAKSGKVNGEIQNVGISGNRLVDLAKRWNQDVIENKPTTLTINIGINDTWRRYDDNDPTSTEAFSDLFDQLLNETTSKIDLELVLCEPFLLHVRPEMLTWREDLDPKIEVIHNLASKYQAKLVKFDQILSAEAEKIGILDLAEDGIHPTELGHKLMAKTWLREVLGS